MRLPPARVEALDRDGLLLLSPFPLHMTRATRATAEKRNDLVVVVNLADEVLVPHAAPGSKTEALCRQIAAGGTPILTFDSPHNANLLVLGAKPIRDEP
jgi:hypothetical protein